MAENSIDCVVTDPPYELGFMGKSWDNTGIAYNIALWKEVLRVLKSGGHLLSFGGSRTYHRMACAIEDAGFEIRDQIMWVYGSGFPKSLNIGKAVDKLQGNEREVISEKEQRNPYIGSDGLQFQSAPDYTGLKEKITKGTSEWEGWGTALKPAHEPIVLARKPLSEKTVAENVLKWGVGGINIDGCRVGTETITVNRHSGYNSNSLVESTKGKWKGEQEQVQGRFPANFIHDGSEEVVDLFPNTGKGNGGKPYNYAGKEYSNKDTSMFNGDKPQAPSNFNDSGSAARFFYCAKASKSERDRGCEGLEERVGIRSNAPRENEEVKSNA